MSNVLHGSTLVLVPSLVLFSSTFCLLYIAAHQYLVALRYLALLQLFAAAVFDILLALKKTKTLGISLNDRNQIILGVAYGLQQTLFQWSLLKLPPACGVALHVTSIPLANLLGTRSYKSKKSVSTFSALAVVFLGLVVDRVAPMNPSALIQGLVALILGAAAQHLKAYWQQDQPHPSPSSPSDTPEVTQSLSALGVSLLLNLAFGPGLFGEKGWGRKTFLILLAAVPLYTVPYIGKRMSAPLQYEHEAAAIIAALVVSAFIPGMRERIAWFDLFAMIAAGSLVLWDAQKAGYRAMNANAETNEGPGS